MNNNKSVRFRYAAVFLSLLAINASAAIVAPGDSAFMPGTSLSGTPELDGSVIYENSLIYDLDPNPLWLVGHPDVKNKVIQSNLANSLVFSLHLLGRLNTTSDDVLIDSVSLNGYAGWQTDVHYRTDAVGDRGPTFVERSADGDNLLFTFGFPLFLGNLVQEVGEESYPIEILTNADFYDTTGRATIRGRTVAGNIPLQVSIAGLAVPTAVPLPASFSLFLAGIGFFLSRGGKHSKVSL